MNQDIIIPQEAKRIASLDGLRALSIAMVIWEHVKGTNHFPLKPVAWCDIFFNGDLGVRIFFVISGFLITTLLLQEEKRCGYISLKLFYQRRALRILPVYWIYILTVVIYAEISGLTIPFWNYFQAFTFTTAWSWNHPWILGHSWSLCVEEVFYLIWPFALTRICPSRRILVAVVGIILGPVLRILNYEFWWRGATHTVWVNADVIMWGCLLALLHEQYAGRMIIIFKKQTCACHVLIIFMFCGLFLTAVHQRLGFITVPLATSFYSLAICYLLYYYSIVSKGLVFRVLNYPAVAFLGTISYGLYLWQQIFLYPKPQATIFLQSFPINILGALAAAVASYYLLEKPFLKLRAKLRHPVKSRPGRIKPDGQVGHVSI